MMRVTVAHATTGRQVGPVDLESIDASVAAQVRGLVADVGVPFRPQGRAEGGYLQIIDGDRTWTVPLTDPDVVEGAARIEALLSATVPASTAAADATVLPDDELVSVPGAPFIAPEVAPRPTLVGVEFD